MRGRIRGASAAQGRAAVLGLLVVVPAVLVLWSCRLGPGVTSDSSYYASAAQSLARTGALRTFSDQPLTVFPPGLSVLLAAFAKAGVGVEAAALAVNLVSLAVVVLLSYLLTSQTLDSPPLGLLAAAVVGLSVSTVHVYSRLWSEPLFCALTMAVLLVLRRAVSRGAAPLGTLVAVGVLVSLACTVRYVGVDLVPVAVLAVVLAERRRGAAGALARGLLVGLLSGAGIVLVALRNLSLHYGPMGARYDPVSPHVGRVVTATLHALADYAVPSGALSLPVGVLLVLVVGWAAWAAFRSPGDGMVVVAAFVVVYWASLWYSELTTTIDPVDQRLSLPVFAPMVVLLVYGGRRLVRALSERSARLQAGVRATVVAATAAVLCLAMTQGVDYAATAARVGIGYDNRAAARSPLLDTIRALPASDGVAATDPGWIYWTTRRMPVGRIPLVEPHDTEPARTKRDVGMLVRAIARGEITRLAYFRGDRTALPPRALQRAGVHLWLVAVVPDGALYAADTAP